MAQGLVVDVIQTFYTRKVTFRSTFFLDLVVVEHKGIFALLLKTLLKL